MDNGTWSRAYYTVVVLSVILIPPCSLIASAVLTSTSRVCQAERVLLPSFTAMMVRFNPWGIGGIAAGVLSVIIVLSLRRRRLDSVLISGVLLVLCILFMVMAIVAGHTAFIGGR